MDNWCQNNSRCTQQRFNQMKKIASFLSHSCLINDKEQVLYFVMKYDIVFAFFQIAIEHKMRNNYLLSIPEVEKLESSLILFSLLQIFILYKKNYTLHWNFWPEMLIIAYFFRSSTFSEKKSRKSSFFIISVYKIVILFTCIIYIAHTYVVMSYKV